MPRQTPTRALLPALAAALLFVGAAPVAAQTLELIPPPPEEARLSFGFQHPNLAQMGDGLATSSGAYELSFAAPITSRFVLLARIPYSRTSLDFPELDWWDGPPPPEMVDIDGSSLGNVFLGLQSRPEPDDSRSWTTFGLFLPTGADDAGAFAGAAADPTRPERFSPETMTLYGEYAWRRAAPGLSTQGAVGLQLHMVMLDDYAGDPGEMFLNYGQSVSWGVGEARLVAELSGLMVITEQPDDFDDRFLNNFALGLGWRLGRLTPTVYYRWPLNENVGDLVQSVFGLRLDWALPVGG